MKLIELFYSLCYVLLGGAMYCVVALCTVWWRYVLCGGAMYCVVALCTVWWCYVLCGGAMYCVVAPCTVWWDTKKSKIFWDAITIVYF